MPVAMSFKHRMICLFSCLLTALLACQPAGKSERPFVSWFPADAPAATLRVNGLSCPLCAHNIDQQLMRVPGVRAVFVNLGKGEVTVAMSETGAPSRDQLSRAIAASGFSLVNIEMDTSASTRLCKTCNCVNCSCVIATQRCDAGCLCS